MAGTSLVERISTSFSAWECRGRGWQLADYPVALEPPYRSFFLLPVPGVDHKHIDDGRRPTFLSSVFERTRDWLKGSDPPAEPDVSPYEEQTPFPAFERDGLVTRRLLVPSDFTARPAVTAQLLAALTTGMHSVALEIIGYQGKVAVQVVASVADAEQVAASINGYLPDVAAIESGDLLSDAWPDAGEKLIVDFGYDDEFFLPFAGAQAFHADPYVPLVAALARAQGGEALCFQVLFERACNPWRKAILEAVAAPDGSALFGDAPEFVPLAREKTAHSLYACIVRLAAQSSTRDRMLDLIRGAGAFFSQLARPGANRLVPLTNDDYPDSLHEYAFLHRETFRTGMIVSTDELMALVHIPDASVRHEAFARDERRTKAVPPAARGHALVIGENVHRGIRELASIGTAERLAHTLIAGASGTGKSTLLLHMILQDMERGDGVLVLDPHGDLVDDVLARIPNNRSDDVVVFDPADESWPVGLNVLDAATDRERILLASDLVGVFQRLSTSWGDTMGTVLSNAVLAILESTEGGTLLHLRRFLVDEAYRNAFLKTVHDEEVLFFWRKEWPLIGSRSIGPILTRLNAFLRPRLIRHIVGQRRPRVRLSEVVDGNKIFLAKLSQGLIGEENAYLLGSLILSRFLQITLARQSVSREARQPFWIYLDEAEHLVTPSVASFVTGVRKYAVGMHLSIQHLAQLRSLPQVEHAVLGNAHTRIMFRVGDDDARKLADGLSAFDASDLRNLAKGEAIVRFGEGRNDFNLATFPIASLEEEIGDKRRQETVARSRAQYAAALPDLMVELDQFREGADSASKPSPHAPRNAQSPRPPEKEASVAPVGAEPASKPAMPRAKEPRETHQLGRGGAVHKYLQQLIQRLAGERGFRATIEEPIKGGQVDVALRRDQISVACQVSVTTDVPHELESVRKCIASGFAHVWIVASEKRHKDKLSQAAAALSNASHIYVLEPCEIVAALDAIAPIETSTERVVGGYTVRATRRVTSYDDYERRQSIMASVIARSLRKGKKEEQRHE
jgi:hypothetical protein